MGQTRVDLLHLLEDLRDAYPGSLEETVLTEIVANSLDSGATRIVLTADPAQAALLVLDDGAGMKRAELARFHDVAASRKTRGEGIGFAGVGIKLGLLASSEVVTETRRGKTHVATRWRLASRHRAPWKWEPPAGAIGKDGTAVTLRLRNPFSPLLDAGFLEETLRRQFQPLFEPDFAGILASHYPAGVTFAVNGRTLGQEERAPQAVERHPIALRLRRRRLPSAFGYLCRSRQDATLPEGQRGVAVSTFGKVIKRGWDWLGIFPADPDRIGGLVEAPLLSASLTLAKNDFIRTGPKGGVYLSFRKSLQEAVSSQLTAWGETPGRGEPRSRRARPYERDLALVLGELAEDFPMLQSLIEKRSGGQKKLPVGEPFKMGPGEGVITPAHETPSAAPPEPGLESLEKEPQERAAAPREPETAPMELPAARRGKPRPAHFSLKLQFEKRPESDELGRLAEDTIWVNEAHPACRRAAASRSEGYHMAVAAAMALSTVAVLPEQQGTFVSAFLSRWGAAIDRPARRRRR
jgi:hypothetical protein